jgi:hypothetical protein
VELRTYTVKTERSGNWWAFSIPEIPGALGQAKRLGQVDVEARDVIAMMLEVDEDSFGIQLDVKLDPETEHIVAEAKDARAKLEDFQRIAAEQSRKAAERLKSKTGLSTRDIGSLLGISFQRVSQVLGDVKHSRRKVS